MANTTTPVEALAASWKTDLYSKEFADRLDNEDPLRSMRSEFIIPKKTIQKDGEKEQVESWYFCGNSLGCLPKRTKETVNEELDVWAEMGVEAHFPEANSLRPWVITDEFVQEMSAKIVGAKDKSEVAIMNSLTVNLHLFMISFYKPTSSRFKIIMEGHAFPSDRYAVRSQVEMRGVASVDDAVIELRPREGEHTLRTEDIVDRIKEEGDTVALVMLSGVQYYTGQFFELEKITKAAHEVGAFAGFDLAHAAGNVEVQLHDWDVDFACWCTYKYLNGGPGNIGGAFVHAKHAGRVDIDRLCGWWGHKLDTRFDMTQPFDPIPGAFAWRLSNPPVLCIAALLGSLQTIEKAGGLPVMRKKSLLLTGYLEHLLNHELGKEAIEILTPTDPAQRGCQLSLFFLKDDALAKVQTALESSPPICDIRKPNVMRVAPVPLYNSFSDVYNFVHWLKKVLA